MMDPPNGSLPQVNFSKTSDLDHLDQSHHTHMNIAQDPDLGPTQTPKIVIETTNVEISDDRGSPTARVAYSPASRAKKSVRWSQDLVEERTLPPLEKSDNNNNSYYVNRSRGLNDSDAAGFNMNNSMVTIKDTFGRWRKKVGEATKKAEDLAGNTWQHLKTAPSLTDGALGRIAQGTKVLAEGGYEKIFRQTFETVPEELLVNSYACYLSTSAGPVLGVIYVSTAKIAFCSDSPMSYKTGDKTEWSYYKVIIPFQQMKAVNPSSSRAKSAEKYIQVISVDGHEFWYMGFLNYDGAVKCLQDALQARSVSSIV